MTDEVTNSAGPTIPEPEDTANRKPENAGSTLFDRNNPPAKIRSKKRSRTGVYVVFAVTAVGLASLGAWQTMSPQSIASRFTSPPHLDDTPAGRQLATSERYEQTLNAVNTQNAQQAAMSGQSFLSTPDRAITDLTDIDAEDEKPRIVAPTLPPANIKPEAATAPAQAERVVTQERPVYYQFPQSTVVENDYSDIKAISEAMAKQANSLRERMSPGGARREVVIKQELYSDKPTAPTPSQSSLRNGTIEGRPDPTGIDAGTYSADLEVGIRSLPDAALDLPVRSGAMPRNYGPYGYPVSAYERPTSTLAAAGSVSYARIINGTDSDTPGPIIAEVTSGKLEGARLIGQVTANRETTSFVLAFDRIVLPDATNISTTAYAVDAQYGDLPIRSAYDPRYFQRYGPRLAGAFMRGFGRAIGTTGTTIVGVGDGVAIVSPQQDAVEGVASGVADVGDQLASEIDDMGPKTGLIKLYANKMIGILFLDNVRRDG